MKKFFLIITIVLCYFYISIAQTMTPTSSVKTPNGSTVPDTRTHSGWDYNYNFLQLAVIDVDLALNFGAMLVGEPTWTYNCHGFAWHVSEGGSKAWIGWNTNTAHNIYFSNLDLSYVECNPNEATKVDYHPSGNHSAVLLSTIWYCSKWGDSPFGRTCSEFCS